MGGIGFGNRTYLRTTTVPMIQLLNVLFLVGPECIKIHGFSVRFRTFCGQCPGLILGTATAPVATRVPNPHPTVILWFCVWYSGCCLVCDFVGCEIYLFIFLTVLYSNAIYCVDTAASNGDGRLK